MLDALKPGKKRLLSYAADLGLLVEAKLKTNNQRVTRISISHGVMTQNTQERQEQSYTIRNRDTAPRVLVIEHPARPEWKLSDGEIPAESFRLLSPLSRLCGAEENHNFDRQGVPSSLQPLRSDQYH